MSKELVTIENAKSLIKDIARISPEVLNEYFEDNYPVVIKVFLLSNFCVEDGYVVININRKLTINIEISSYYKRVQHCSSYQGCVPGQEYAKASKKHILIALRKEIEKQINAHYNLGD